jgi:gluconate 2-dehydrogenase gamma chain
MERRDLIRFLATTTGLACLDRLTARELLALGTAIHQRPAGGAQGMQTLDAHARRTVIAAAERIIPASDTPGATDADVVTFIDRMLAGWYTPEERDRFLAGLRALDARCRALRGKDFADCGERDQVAVLTAFDDEVAALRRASGRANDHWFAMLKYTTAFGYCTSEVAMRHTLGVWPRPGRYDGCAPVASAPAPRER